MLDGLPLRSPVAYAQDAGSTCDRDLDLLRGVPGPSVTGSEIGVVLDCGQRHQGRAGVTARELLTAGAEQAEDDAVIDRVYHG